MLRFMSFVGLFSMIAIAFVCSSNKKKIAWKTVISGILLQVAFGLVILKTEFGRKVFELSKSVFMSLINFANEGNAFLFGDLSDPSKSGFIFIIMLVGSVIFVSSLMSVLYHLGVMQVLIKGVAWVMMRVMKTSGAESLAAAANIFAGQTEAPLVIKPYVETMTRSEIMALMTGGMATVAGGVLAAYVGFGIDAGHLLAASVMSAPAALVCAKLMVPETEDSLTIGEVKLKLPKTAANVIDAAATGAGEGVKLVITISAMLLAFIALVAMLNGILGQIGGLFGFEKLSLELIMGYLFSPISFLMGVPWEDCQAVGSLLGKKFIINEFVAYLDLKDMLNTLSPRSVIIATYALCGFANFSSIAIQLGGIGTIAPSQRRTLAQLGIRSLIGGTLACLMTACIAGILL